MGLRDVAPIIEADNFQRIQEETWGHLAPMKNKTYKVRIVFAIGCYDSGELNPTAMVVDGLPNSPWECNAVCGFLSDLPEKYREGGSVYEWCGTFMNYVFTTERIRKVYPQQHANRKAA